MSLDIQTEYDKIYKYCYYKVKNRDNAEDLTQETFLSFFSQSDVISHGQQLAYLYTIAKNKCIDFYRHKTSESLDDNVESDDEFDNVITNIAVRQAIDTLDSDLAEILLLRFSSELQIGEIAIVLGISRFAVHRKINSALKQLNQILRKEDFDE